MKGPGISATNNLLLLAFSPRACNKLYFEKVKVALWLARFSMVVASTFADHLLLWLFIILRPIG
jgi:hypothetical protein